MAFQLNQEVFTCTDVNLRATPGYLGDTPPTVLALLAERTACRVTGAALLADGLTWWPVRALLPDGRTVEGWAAAQVGDIQLLTDIADTNPPAPKGVMPVTPVKPVAPTTLHAARSNRLGFYLHSTNNDAGLWDAIARVQPPVMLLHEDAANDLLLREIRDFRAPEAFLIGRFYMPNDAQRALLESSDPEGEGRRFAERILTYDFGKFTRRAASGRLFIDAWMSLNECLPGPASASFCEDPARYQRLYDAYDRFQVAFRARLVQEGVEAVAFNFAAGNFNTAEHYLDFFPRTLAEYTYLGFHEYGWPSLIPGGGTHTGAGLYRSVLEARRSDGAPHRIIITEAGLTRAYGHPQNPDEGWLNREEALDENRYWESLAWYNTLLDQDDVLGACLYQVGHRGDWATFRHLGADNAGRTLRLVERMAALREALALPAATPAATPAPHPMSTGNATLAGQVTLDGSPVAGVVVRLVGSLGQLGSVRGAGIDLPGAVTWSRAVTGFSGTLRTAWDRCVAGEIAGLTWAEFKHQASIANPALAASGGRFTADQRYYLPEATRGTPAFLWDRTVSGYQGTIHQAWLDHVQGKVLGMSYAAFRRQVVAYNPAIELARGRLLADRQYLLPRTAGAERYVLTTTTSTHGRFRFGQVPIGKYTVEIAAPGAPRFTLELTVEGTMTVAWEIAPTALARPPATMPELPAAAPRAGGFVGTAGQEFVIDGRVLRFVGVNVRGLVWYGSGRTLPFTQPDHRQEVLDRAREMGARVVRVFLPCVNAATQESIDRLRAALQIAGERGLFILPAFVDFYSTTDFRIPGDDHFYEKLDPNFPINLLNAVFYRGGYHERYLPFVRAVVAAFRDDPRIFAWEIGNELKYEPAFQDPGRAVFLNFMHSVAREIKAIDPNHLVTTGMISASHASLDQGDLWRRLYGGPEFDFLTIHCYNEQYAGKQDHDYARALEKPFIIEEAGFGREKPGDRVEQIRRDMDRWFGFGARGYMQWGFMPVNGDIGDGDDDSGMDRKWHGGHFDALFDLYRTRAALLQAEADRITPITPVFPDDPADFRPGDTVLAQTSVRVRRSPGFVGKDESDTLAALSPGESALIVGPQEVRDGLTWWLVRLTTAQGLVVEGWAAQATAEAVLLAMVLPGALPGVVVLELLG